MIKYTGKYLVRNNLPDSFSLGSTYSHVRDKVFEPTLISTSKLGWQEISSACSVSGSPLVAEWLILIAIVMLKL